MIAALKGTVFSLAPGRLELETKGGIIYQILTPISAYSRLRTGEEVLLHTVQKVKDEDILLFGFLDSREKKVFEKLIQVSGIGGRLALSCISALPLEELASAIETADADRISTVPGIGKKTAQRIILELTGKLDLEKLTPDANQRLKDELVSALLNLGYAPKSARDAVTAIFQEKPEQLEFETLFKTILRRVGK